jgi:hypothetical protein
VNKIEDERRGQGSAFFVLNSAAPDHHALIVIARLDRLNPPWMPRSSRGMTAVVDAIGELITRPVMKRRVKSSFTIRVDQTFTSSRQPAFTNAFDQPLKTPAIA